MDLEYALKWMVGLNSLLQLVLTVRHFRFQLRGGVIASVGLLLLIAVGEVWDLAGWGYVVALCWGLFVVLPSIAVRQMATALRRHDLSAAARWANVAGTLLPFDGQRLQAKLISFQAYLDQGQTARAQRALEPLLRSDVWRERAQLELLRLTGDWAAIIAHVRAQPVGTRDIRVASLYMTALGETGDIAELWRVYSELPAPLAGQPMVRLQLAAYSGMLQATRRLLDTHFPAMPVALDRCWIATALQVLGQRDDAELLLHPVAAAGAPGRFAARRRLERPLAPRPGEDLPASVRMAMQRFVRRLEEEQRLAPVDVGIAWGTIGLALVLAVVFLRSVPDGATNPENLVDMGALVLPAIDEHLAWRIFAAGFLHFGFTHFAMNTFALWFLGRQVERLFGASGMLAEFVGASTGAFGSAVWYYAGDTSVQRFFLGASAGVFGLVGAIAAHAAVGHFVSRSSAFLGRLRAAALIVAAQMLFDFFTPVTSSFLHLMGFAFGALVALPLALKCHTRSAAPVSASRAVLPP